MPISPPFCTHSVARFSRRIAIALLALLQSSCGTVVYSHNISVSIDDPTRRLGTGPFEVSVFDHQMGYSESWAKKTMGTASTESPYKTTLAGSGAQMFFDPPRPKQVVLSIAVPKLEPTGYLMVTVAPGEKTTGDVPANLTPYGEYFPPPKLPIATVHYDATAAPKGWTLNIRVKIPPAPPG